MSVCLGERHLFYVRRMDSKHALYGLAILEEHSEVVFLSKLLLLLLFPLLCTALGLSRLLAQEVMCFTFQAAEKKNWAVSMCSPTTPLINLVSSNEFSRLHFDWKHNGCLDHVRRQRFLSGGSSPRTTREL